MHELINKGLNIVSKTEKKVISLNISQIFAISMLNSNLNFAISDLNYIESFKPRDFDKKDEICLENYRYGINFFEQLNLP